jgi:polyisoprenoid-binding protein YceI
MCLILCLPKNKEMTINALEIDNSQSQVSFRIKKIGFLTIKGTLSDIQGNIVFDQNDLNNSNFDVSVGATTINTGNNKRDEHLKSNDFFSVKEFPKISFQSSKILKDKKQFLAIGQLTILNKTNEVSIRFNYKNKSLEGDFSLNRLDYDLGKKFPTFIVGKTVHISINTKIK